MPPIQRQKNITRDTAAHTVKMPFFEPSDALALALSFVAGLACACCTVQPPPLVHRVASPLRDGRHFACPACPDGACNRAFGHKIVIDAVPDTNRDQEYK